MFEQHNGEIFLTELLKKKRKVMIGSPSYDGNINVWYANSLMQTIKLAESLDIEIIPIWISFDALIQRARNDTIAIAIEQDVDDLIWIDTDIEWKPEWFFKLLDYPVDVVGGTYPKKGDNEMYVVNLGNYNGHRDPITGLIQVAGLGTGFLRFSKKACKWLWENSPPYNEPEKGNSHKRWIFEVVIKNADLISEDIWVCKRLTEEAGISVYLDPTITCNHVGGKKYTGDFLTWVTNSRTPNISPRIDSGIKYLTNYLK